MNTRFEIRRRPLFPKPAARDAATDTGIAGQNNATREDGRAISTALILDTPSTAR